MNESRPELEIKPATQADELKASAHEVVDETKAAASHAADSVREHAQVAADQAKEAGREAADALREEGSRMILERKDQALRRIDRCGTAVRHTAEKLSEEGDENLAHYAGAVADGIGSFSNYLRRQDFRGVWADTERLVRTKPELVFGGMFIAGLAISRFLKAGSRSEPARQEAKVPQPVPYYSSPVVAGKDPAAQI